MAAPGPAVKIIMPVYEGVDMLDVCGPYEMFRWAGFETDLVAEVPGTVRFNGGFCFDVPAGLGDATSCDALWVPGGDPGSLSRIMHDRESAYRGFLIRQAAASRHICSVCEGALLLADAGLLDGYQVTTHWAFIPYLLEHYPKVKIADGHPRFVHDRNRLTGGGISAGLDQALKLIELLAGPGKARSVQQDTQYYPDPPVASEIPNMITSPMPAPPTI
jgi:cyclohexyl-isocyanide hydratase